MIAFVNWGVLVGPSAKTSLSSAKRSITSVSASPAHRRFTTVLKKQNKTNLNLPLNSALRAY
jgi:hypothetical protein